MDAHTPPAIERIQAVGPNTVLQIREGDKVVYTVTLPAGPVRITVENLRGNRQ